MTIERRPTVPTSSRRYWVQMAGQPLSGLRTLFVVITVVIASATGLWVLAAGATDRAGLATFAVVLCSVGLMSDLVVCSRITLGEANIEWRPYGVLGRPRRIAWTEIADVRVANRTLELRFAADETLVLRAAQFWRPGLMVEVGNAIRDRVGSHRDDDGTNDGPAAS